MMNKITKSISRVSCLVGALLALTACSYNATDYAAQGDWNMVGYSDGVKGKLSRGSSQLEALTQHGDADVNAYAQGYLRGNAEYCNPQHAYQIGLSGSYYEGACEGTADAQKFRMEWQRGWNDSGK